MMDEKFFAWLDGELDPAEAGEMEERVAADPELARLAEDHRALTSRLRTAFETVRQEPWRPSIATAVPKVAPLTDINSWRERRANRSLPQWAAMAATLALGIFLGTLTEPADGPVQTRDGQVYAAAALDRALDEQLASHPTGDVQIGLTFRDASGAVCRSFSESAVAGVACRKGNDWQVRGLFASPGEQDREYRMATGADLNLAALVDQTIAGEPFDARQEAEVKKRGWR